MKKSISLLLVLALIIGLFSHFSTRNNDANPEEETLNVTIVVSSAFGDKSLNDSAKEGGELLKTNPGINVKYIECKQEGIKQKLMDAAEDSHMVVAVGWECYEISEVAVEYPDVKFILADTEAEGMESIPNLMSITFAQNEGAFLAGYMAGAMSETGVLGVLAEEETVNSKDYITGFSQGAKHANPDITVITQVSADPADAVVTREETLQLADQNADIILNLDTAVSRGILQAAYERELLVVGSEADQKLISTEYDKVILCSVKKDLGMAIYDVVMQYADEDIWNEGKVTVTGLKEGHVSLVYGNENSVQLADDYLKAEVEKLAQSIENGDIKVKTAR